MNLRQKPSALDISMHGKIGIESETVEQSG